MSTPVSGSDVTQRDSTPTAKVTAGTLTGALATVLLYFSARFGLQMTAGDGAAFATLLFFAASWFKNSRPSDNDR